jgi:type I restriction enzyme R subunit
VTSRYATFAQPAPPYDVLATATGGGGREWEVVVSCFHPETRAVTPDKAITAVRELFHFAYWLTRTYARVRNRPVGITFSPQSLPRTTHVATATLKQLQKTTLKFEENAKIIEEAERQKLANETQRVEFEAQIAAMRAEIAATRKVNAAWRYP